MLEMILNFFVDMVADFLKILIGLFNTIMVFDLAKFGQIFPVAHTFYVMFQAIGIGLVMTIAIFNLFKFFAGPLTRTTEKPTSILIRSFFAIGLIYFGNYLLSIIFDATHAIYDAFTTAITDTSALDAFGQQGSMEGAIAGDAAGAVVGGPTILLIMIIICIALVIQFVKMMLEILERFITLCLLIYSSPLAWSTFASESSSNILKKWLSMYFGQCILMILSAWGVSMFISVLQGGAGLIIRILYAFAMVKIIKRFDNYLQQVGLNAAGMGGGSLLDSIATTGMMLGLGKGGKGGGGGGSGGILGKNLFGRLGQSSGLMQGILGARGALQNAGGNGSFMSKVGTAVKGFGSGFAGGTSIGGAIQRASGVKKAGGSNSDALKSVFAGRKNNPMTVDQAASRQKAKTSVAQHGQALKSATDSKAKGTAAADALRSLSSMSPEAANSPDVKALANSVGETLRSDPVAAFEAMNDIAEQGGLELSGDAATAAWEGFVGAEAFNAAFGMEDYDAPPTFTNQTLTIGTDENGGHTFDYAGTVEAADGSLTSVEWSNRNGEVAQQYAAAKASYEKADLDAWKSSHEGVTMKDGHWTDKSGATYTGPATPYRAPHIEKVESRPAASVHDGSYKTQTTYVKRATPKPPAKPAKPPRNV